MVNQFSAKVVNLRHYTINLKIMSNLLPEFPDKKSNAPKDKLMFLFGVLCVIYLLNPTFGFLEFLPDRLPIIGNLDEAAATTGLLFVLRYFGYDIGKWFQRK
jgi:hypothetical protein